jgi:hypothetical protein
MTPMFVARRAEASRHLPLRALLRLRMVGHPGLDNRHGLVTDAEFSSGVPHPRLVVVSSRRRQVFRKSS